MLSPERRAAIEAAAQAWFEASELPQQYAHDRIYSYIVGATAEAERCAAEIDSLRRTIQQQVSIEDARAERRKPL